MDVRSAKEIIRNEPFVDLRVQVSRDGEPRWIRFTVFDEFGTAKLRLAVDPYNYRHLMELSDRIYRAINARMDLGGLTVEDFRRPEIAGPLQDLNGALYSMRFANPGSSGFDDVGELFADVIGSSHRPTIGVDGDIGLIPWELTSPAGAAGFENMLGTLAHLCGEMPRDGYKPAASLNAPRSLFGQRSGLTFDGTLRLRAAGNANLRGASAEEQVVKSPAPFAEGRVAAPVTRAEEEVAFFSHFSGDDYQIVHFYCHCSYDAAGFLLKVSKNDYPLAARAFATHRVKFKRNVFHFLNVCAGAPTPATRDRSFLEYLCRQQHAGGAIASLTAVRSVAAVDVARAFYSHYLPKTASEPGRNAVEALGEARRDLLRKDIVVGYMYRVFGQPGAYLSPYEQHVEAVADPTA